MPVKTKNPDYYQAQGWEQTLKLANAALNAAISETPLPLRYLYRSTIKFERYGAEVYYVWCWELV